MRNFEEIPRIDTKCFWSLLPLDLFVAQHSESFKFNFPDTFLCCSLTTKKYTFIFHFLSQSPHLIYGQIQFFRHLNQCYGRNSNNQRQQIELNFRQITIIDGFNNFFGEFFGFFGIFFGFFVVIACLYVVSLGGNIPCRAFESDGYKSAVPKSSVCA